MESTETDRNLESTESIVVMIQCCSFVERLEREVEACNSI